MLYNHLALQYCSLVSIYIYSVSCLQLHHTAHYDSAGILKRMSRPSAFLPDLKSNKMFCRFVNTDSEGSLTCTSPTTERKYFALENIQEPSQKYLVPLERFWTADRLDLHSEPFIRGMIVMVALDTTKSPQEFVGRKKTRVVEKAVLCYPDSCMPKNSYVDVL